MTESQWLVSEDPAAMLVWMVTPDAPQAGPPRKPSDRQKRLWVEACRNREMAYHPERTRYPAGGAALDTVEGLAFCVQAWIEGGDDDVPMAERAALLRDVVGNPFRPVTLPMVGYGGVYPPHGRIKIRSVKCPWITPQVLSLAQAAYSGEWSALGPLSDALEEAGMNDSDPCACDNGWLVGTAGRFRCDVCKGCGRLYRPHPILAHLRSPGPHVRGCWVIDLIRGET